jgi:hypothetical protein
MASETEEVVDTFLSTEGLKPTSGEAIIVFVLLYYSHQSPYTQKIQDPATIPQTAG